MKSSPRAFMEEFLKSNTIDYKTVEKIFLCIMGCCLNKHP